jgi:hypothetical protein
LDEVSQGFHFVSMGLADETFQTLAVLLYNQVNSKIRIKLRIILKSIWEVVVVKMTESKTKSEPAPMKRFNNGHKTLGAPESRFLAEIYVRG